jgi:hypothetical protein
MSIMTINNIEIEVIHKDIKNIHLSIHPPKGRVRIATPLKMSDEAIRLFAISKLAWIKKNQKHFDDQKRQSPREFLSGESHYFLGHRYLLKVIETKGIQRVEIKNKKVIHLYMRSNHSVRSREKVMSTWYRQELKIIVPELISKWEPLLNVNVKDWGVKLMKTKWGTCNHLEQRIWINLELTKKNIRCIEYIVVHEMIHLIEKDHNENYKKILDEHIPRWKSVRRELNEIIFESKHWDY